MASATDRPRGGVSFRGWHPAFWGCLAAGAVAVVVLGGSRVPHMLARRRLEVAIAGRDWLAACAALDRLEAGRPIEPENRFLRGRLLRRQGDLLDAEAYFAAAVAAGFDPAAVRRQRLLATAQSGEILAVEDDILQLAEAGVDDELAEECYEAMVEGYVKAYRLREASQAIDLWLRWQPDNPLAYYWRGVVFETGEKWGEARAAYATAVAKAPRLYTPRRALARMERETARLPEAARQFEACLAQRPDEPAALLGLAGVRLVQGERRTAAALYEHALTLGINRERRAEPLAELAQMAVEDGAADRGLAFIDEAITIDPRSARFRRIRAAALVQLGRDAEAAEEQEVARALSEAQVELTRLIRDALSYPDDADRRVAVGLFLLGQGLDAEGSRWLQLALQIDPRQAAAHRALAELWERQGDPARAAVHRRGLEPDATAEPAP